MLSPRYQPAGLLWRFRKSAVRSSYAFIYLGIEIIQAPTRPGPISRALSDGVNPGITHAQIWAPPPCRPLRRRFGCPLTLGAGSRQHGGNGTGVVVPSCASRCPSSTRRAGPCSSATAEARAVGRLFLVGAQGTANVVWGRGRAIEIPPLRNTSTEDIESGTACFRFFRSKDGCQTILNAGAGGVQATVVQAVAYVATAWEAWRWVLRGFTAAPGESDACQQSDRPDGPVNARRACAGCSAQLGHVEALGAGYHVNTPQSRRNLPHGRLPHSRVPKRGLTETSSMRVTTYEQCTAQMDPRTRHTLPVSRMPEWAPYTLECRWETGWHTSVQCPRTIVSSPESRAACRRWFGHCKQPRTPAGKARRRDTATASSGGTQARACLRRPPTAERREKSPPAGGSEPLGRFVGLQR